jgi:23S rRNA pseudouridine2605 synthase
MAVERLQKIMAGAGVGSRRKCEELITAGRVQVNGVTVAELGAKADPARDRIVVDGKPLHFTTRHAYYKLHKPRGVLSDIGGDATDPHTGGERKTVANYLPEGVGRLFPVGRLDFHSEGLVLLTDDGELANRLTHPRYQHPKTYYVLVAERPSEAALAQLRAGVDLPEGDHSAPAEVTVVEQLPADLKLSMGPTEGIWLCVILREGKKRQIRHMTAAVDIPTLRLVRWAIGPLTMSGLTLGKCEPLKAREVSALRRLAGLETAPAPEKKPLRRRPTGVDRGPKRLSEDQPKRRRPSKRPPARRPSSGRPSSRARHV